VLSYLTFYETKQKGLRSRTRNYIRLASALTQHQLLNRLLDFHEIRYCIYEGWNFNSGNYLFTTDTK